MPWLGMQQVRCKNAEDSTEYYYETLTSSNSLSTKLSPHNASQSQGLDLLGATS